MNRQNDEMSEEMDSEIYREITRLTEKANDDARRGQYAEAKDLFWSAFDLIPEPKSHWKATTWILASIGDMWFHLCDYEKARLALKDAVICPEGLGNPFIHMRLGQIAFETGDTKRAADELARAYMSGGREIFAKENPKYFDFLKVRLEPPLGQQHL